MKLLKALLKRITDPINRAFRKHYENRISLPYGMARFISNVAFIQLTHEQFVSLMPCMGIADLWVTTVGLRPVLHYKVFLEDWVQCECIIEERGLQVREEIEPLEGEPQQWTDWEMVSIDDKRVEKLKDMFLGFAFYTPLLAEHKRPLLTVAKNG